MTYEWLGGDWHRVLYCADTWALRRMTEQPDPGDTIPDEPNDPVPEPEGEPE